ncbi:YwhD family protein [Pseudalkalibacillus caeni]|uniref:YwhD family protein n=1 Tax=Exobacillus caeni TaxID=2574798 RepID=UPI0026ADD4AC
MANEESKKKKKGPTGFNILSGDSTSGHGGYGVGTISLDNISPVIIDPENNEIFVDMGALHARSAIEKRIKLVKNGREEVPDGRTCWIVWVTVNRVDEGPYYHGVGEAEFFVDSEARRAWKSMPEHVNNMDKSMKGKVVLDRMDEKSKKMLKEYLIGFDESMWNRSSQELHEALDV